MKQIAINLNLLACGISAFAFINGHIFSALLLLALHIGSIAVMRSKRKRAAALFILYANVFFAFICAAIVIVTVFQHFPVVLLEQMLSGLAVTLFSLVPMTLNFVVIKELYVEA